MRFLILFIFFITNSLANETNDIKNLVINKELKKHSGLTFLDGENKQFNLDKYTGNLILLNFWATWCAPCKEEMPSLDLLQTNKKLDNLKVLEVGSGAGRFSEVFLNSTRCNLYSIDYSSAVEANLRNNKRFKSRLILSQASIYQIPFKNNSFDKIFCFGVLQHTPSFEKSLVAISKKLKISGELVVDFYPIKSLFTFFHSKYVVRLISPYIPKEILLQIIKISAPFLIELFDLFCKLRL